jgi:hypothetical protein
MKEHDDTMRERRRRFLPNAGTAAVVRRMLGRKAR